MTIGIIWSLAAKGMLILKNTCILPKNKIRSEPLGPSVRPPLSEPPVHKKVLCFKPFPKVLTSGQFGHLRVDCLVHTCTLGLYCNVVQLRRCSISHYVAHALVTVFILLFLGHVYL